MELSDELLSEISYVKISSYREKVMNTLKDVTKMPSEIAKDAGIRQNHISNVLRQLKEHEMVECLNPEVKKGRLYRLTEKGEKIVENIDKFD